MSYGATSLAGPPPAPVPYASFWQRAAAYLIDQALSLLVSIPWIVAYVAGVVLIAVQHDPHSPEPIQIGPAVIGCFVAAGLLGLAALGFAFWNVVVRQGRTGRSIGKSVLGITLVREATGQPTGTWLGLGRQLLHVVDGACYIGYLWPLWDDKRQTFADKLVATVVIEDPRP
jgi:uncharacterized RDD family membrane protein YckC